MKTKEFWENKGVLITGGTSGLGLALREQLLGLGARVAVVARKAGSDTDANLIQADISDKRQIHSIHAQAISKIGKVDVLINNASSLGPTPLRLLLDTECEDFENVLQTNVLGPFRLVKLVAGGMVLSRFGVIVNISSDAAVNSYPRWGAYSVSKAALDHLTRIFQAELEETGIKFMALDPGDMNTPLHFAAIPEADPRKLNSPFDSARLILEQIAEERFSPTRRSIR